MDKAAVMKADARTRSMQWATHKQDKFRFRKEIFRDWFT